MNDLKALLATLNHAVWNRHGVIIDGSSFSLEELSNIVQAIDKLLDLNEVDQ